MADSWPRLLVSDDVIIETEGMNLPIAGAIHAGASAELLPILWCAAEPGGPVTDEAFDWVCSKLVDALTAIKQVDAIYLDLHGAMVTESHEDGEGELLTRIREALGNDIPIGVSLDLHANITATMTDKTSLMTVYRTYPHLDMADTGSRCMRRLLDLCKRSERSRFGKQKLETAFRQIPFMVPLHAQYTGAEPCMNLYQIVEASDESGGQWAELALGFTASDIVDCGPSVIAYADTKSEANRLADFIFERICRERDSFDTALLTATEAVEYSVAHREEKPILLADVQDNPGAGGSSDTTGLLRALITGGAQKTVLGVLCDPGVAELAHSLGEGESFFTELGAKSGIAGQQPVNGEYRVISLSNGNIEYTGEMYGGGFATLGPSCLLSVNREDCDISIVVSTNRIQCLDRALFEHFGVDLHRCHIICVKSTVHYRADFEPLCARVINVAVPGSFSCSPKREDYRRLRPDMGFLN